MHYVGDSGEFRVLRVMFAHVPEFFSPHVEESALLEKLDASLIMLNPPCDPNRDKAVKETKRTKI